MAILNTDIKLLKSQVLLDTDDGGGAMTANAVIDGQSNNLFPDISELDRTYGRVSLRKAFASVMTMNTDSYYGAHAIISEAPEDPKVSTTLFSTKDWTDRRTSARNRVEQYLARGPKWPGQLLETQLTGQRAITLLMKPTDAVPKVGQSLSLVQFEGLSTEFEQYVRVTKITSVQREFTTSGSVKWQGLQVTVEISDPLRYDFIGPVASPYDDIANIKAICRDTRVANAASYYGISNMVEAGAINDLQVKASSIFSQLVPSAQAETPLIDLTAGGAVAAMVTSASADVTLTVNLPSYPVSRYIGYGIKPGSFRLNYSGNSLVTDSGGQLMQNGLQLGTINYDQGTFTLATTTGFTGNITATFTPAVPPVQVAQTACIDVSTSNRGNVYVLTLFPPPAPRALAVSFMAQGKWYTLSDVGGTGTQGILRGSEASIGSGTLDYQTGTVVITTGALPDVGSSVIYAWGVPVTYFNRQAQAIRTPSVEFTITPQGGDQFLPNGATITWPTLTTGNYVANISSAGEITGAATGTLRLVDGETGTYRIRLIPTVLPLVGTEFAINYNRGFTIKKTFAAPTRNGGGQLAIDLVDLNIIPNSLRVSWNTLINNYDVISTVPAEMQYINLVDPIVSARDNGAGVLVRPNAGAAPDAVTSVVDYALGLVTFQPDITVSIPKPDYSVESIGIVSAGALFSTGGPTTPPQPVYRNTMVGITYFPAAATFPIDESGYVMAEYQIASAATSAELVTTPMTSFKFDITDRYQESIVPGSVRFSWGGKNYYDVLGNLFTDLDMTTGSGTVAGTISYASGIVEITNWTVGQANTVSMQSLLTEIPGQPVDGVVFRIATAPIRSGSVQIAATPLLGARFFVTADETGKFISTKCFGTVDYQTGIVRLFFGQRVTAAGNETKSWYSIDAVDAFGKITKPLPVMANTINYNAVAYSYMPLSADILGLDPVRLPSDGRVPIYRPGDVVVVHHTTKTQFPALPVVGTIVDCLRVRLESVRILDALNAELSANMWSSNLDAGTVELLGPYSLGALTLPLFAEHRVEDMALVSDVQITGELTITRPLTHAYPVTESKISSALIIGDLQARVHTIFSQLTWTSVFSNVLIGSPTTAQFNNVLFPLVTTNKGSQEEQWVIIFQSNTAFNVVGKVAGQIATGTTATNCAPMNPGTGEPYFTIPAAGWGSGWVAGNVLRFNTAAANYPIWVARTVLQGPATMINDDFKLHIRGDIDS